MFFNYMLNGRPFEANRLAYDYDRLFPASKPIPRKINQKRAWKKRRAAGLTNSRRHGK